MLDGLRRLIRTNFRFTISEKTKSNLDKMLKDSCNIVEFFEDKNAVAFEPKAKVTSCKLYEMYFNWCDKNGLESLKRNTFIKWISDNAQKYEITYDKNILEGTSYVRGFKEIRLNGFIK